MFKLRFFASAMAVAVLAISFQVQPAAAAATPMTEADSVVHFALRQVGKPFKWGASGPDRYDCSGLLYRSFRENGLATRIGGYRTSRSYYNWFKEQGRLVSTPLKGDLVVWGRSGEPISHIGLFIGFNRDGAPMAISALTTGVATHRVNAINKPLRGYLRVDLER